MLRGEASIPSHVGRLVGLLVGWSSKYFDFLKKDDCVAAGEAAP
jgi:hypothetical protein